MCPGGRGRRWPGSDSSRSGGPLSPDLGKRGFPVSIHPHEVTKLGRRIENSFRVSLQEEKGTEIACFPDGVRTGGEEGSGPAWFPISVTGIP